MQVTNTFKLSIIYDAVFLSTTKIDDITGEITTGHVTFEDACTDYMTLNGESSTLKLLGNVSDYVIKAYYYNKNKAFLFSETLTPEQEVSHKFYYVAFKLVQCEDRIDVRKFCRIFADANPHYKELKKVYKHETSQLFFRETLEGKVTFWRNDFNIINGASLEEKVMLDIYQNNQHYLSSYFNKTDCTFDYFKGSVETKLSSNDLYTNVLNNFDDKYDIIKLKTESSAVDIVKRCMLQVYIAGRNTISNYIGSNCWDTDVSDSVSDENTLLNTFHFAKGPAIREINIAGCSYPINTTYVADRRKSSWNGLQKMGQGTVSRSSINFRKLWSIGEELVGTSGCPSSEAGYSIGGVFLSHVYTIITDGNNVITSVKPNYDIYYIAITNDYDGHGDAVYTGGIGAYLPAEGFLITNAGNYLMTAQNSSGQFIELIIPQTFYLQNCIVDYNVYSRLICDTDLTTYDNTYLVYNLSVNDFALARTNFRKILRVPIGTTPNDMINIVQVDDEQAEPTIYGQKDSGQYFKPPYIEDYADRIWRPLSRTNWVNTSLWISFNQSHWERFCSGLYKTITHRDCFEISDIIKTLLKQLDPEITIEKNSQYSQFLYGNVEQTLGHENVGIYLEPKSNVLKGNYNQAAKKAEISLKQISNLLRDCFRCYWFIDSEKRFRIEHIRFFNNGQSYDAPQVQYDLTNIFDSYNKKDYMYDQSKIAFNKSELISRYEFAWGESVTEALGQGFTADIIAEYTKDCPKESISISEINPDVDYMLFSPEEFSKDGFALLMPQDGTIPIVERYINTNDGQEALNTVYINNYYASFLSLFKNWHSWDLPALKTHLSTDQEGTFFYGDSLKRFRTHNISYQTMYDPDPHRLIGTHIGNGRIESLSVNLNTRMVEATLVYPPS